jgi:hypothetical protein
MPHRQLLLIRPKPLPDELLSSWLVRLAWENGRKLHPFSTWNLCLPRYFWYRDIDRSTPPELLEQIAQITGTELQMVTGTTLGSLLARFLDERSIVPKGPIPWLLPILPRGRRSLRPGVQFCPECLATDDIPYFRRHWRLSFITVCPTHGIMMVDRCPQCQRPINFHRGDYGFHNLSDEAPWMFCPDCGHDWRDTPRHRAQTTLTLLTRCLQTAVSSGWIKIGSNRTHIIPTLSGIRVLCRMCSSNSRSRQFAIAVSEAKGQLPFATEFSTRHQYVEHLEVDERIRILGLVAWLLADWPKRLIAAARNARLSRSYIREACKDLPFWLSVEVEWDLDGWYYSPTSEERASVVSYLERKGLSTRENNVRRWLGLHFTSGRKGVDSMAPLSKKWCGYGARRLALLGISGKQSGKHP